MEKLAYNIRPCDPLDLDKLTVLIEKHAEFEKAVFTKEAKQARLQAAWFIYLDFLYLEDDYRSYGIGQVLMEKVKEDGKVRGCVNMQWQTPDFNKRAIKFTSA